MKHEVMFRAGAARFAQHAELHDLLLATGEADVAESAPTDYYWGVGREGTRPNKLGRIMQRIRAELRAGATRER
jgi:ribA/ribD-fused uncharacterized protein